MRENIETFRTALSGEARRLGISLTDEELGALAKHYGLIAKWNARVRLVGIREPARAAIELFTDALVVDRFIDTLDLRAGTATAPIKMIDIGAGAGLPGVAVKIRRPAWILAAVDSNAKKASFLKTVLRELRLDGASAVRARAEELARDEDFGKKFDVAFCRAVVSPPRACELAVPFLRAGGVFVAQMNDPRGVEAIRSAADALSVTIYRTETYSLSGTTSDRVLASVRKLGQAAPMRPGGPGTPQQCRA